MEPFRLPAIPGEMRWQNSPLEWAARGDDGLEILAGGKTDWFVDPAGGYAKDNAPAALFFPQDARFILSAKVAVKHASTFDAGVLQLRGDADHWGKLCFEFSPQREPMIVSVVTHGESDDCNSAVIEGDEVFLRIAHTPDATAFHYSRDGRFWHLVRYFTLKPERTTLRCGFSSQSPSGERCTAVFSRISYRAGTLSDIRSGE